LYDICYRLLFDTSFFINAFEGAKLLRTLVFDYRDLISHWFVSGHVEPCPGNDKEH
jgi:hypothetical protein